MVGHPHVTDMSIVAKIRMENIHFLSHAKEVFRSVDLGVILIRDYLLLFGGKPRNLVFSPRGECIDQPSRRRSTVNSTMDPTKLAKLQAQAASNRIGTSTYATSGCVFAGCVHVYVSVLADASALSFVQAGRAQCGER